MMNTSEYTFSPFSFLLFQHSMNIMTSIYWIRAILLLPLSAIIFYRALQKWRQHRSFKTASHFEMFAYNLAAMELLWVLGYLVAVTCSEHFHFAALRLVTTSINLAAFYGEIFFHILVCVDRYVAVVHAVTYLRMRNGCGVRIRTASIGCVWLMSFVMTSPNLVQSYAVGDILLWCFLAFATLATSFCSLSVLCALIRPGPGEKAEKKGLVDRSKQRAFYTISAISGVQWLWFLGIVTTYAVPNYPVLRLDVVYLVRVCLRFSSLPNGFVLPLVYLRRARK